MNYPTLATQIDGIENLGALSVTSVEAIIAVDPDLIIGVDTRFLAFYDVLSVAPTLLYTFHHSGEWQDVAAFAAAATNNEGLYDTQMTIYEARVEDFQSLLGDEEVEVSVVRIRPEELRLYVLASFPSSVIEDVGLLRPESQNYDYEGLLEAFSSTTFYAISLENIQFADGDVIFVWSSSANAELAEDADARRQVLLDDPLWQSLGAIQSDDIYLVGGHWIGSSLILAHYILDDLFSSVLDDNPAEVSPNPFIVNNDDMGGIDATEESSE
ncbi:MAG: ABC transporter substrate-binding protein [Chloroflexota bacterium]